MVTKPSHGRHLSGRSANSKSGRESCPRLPQTGVYYNLKNTLGGREKIITRFKAIYSTFPGQFKHKHFRLLMFLQKNLQLPIFCFILYLIGGPANPWRSHQHIPIKFPAFGFIWPEYSTVKLALLGSPPHYHGGLSSSGQCSLVQPVQKLL